MPGGSLTVVGTGIRAGIQLTEEAREAISGADEVFVLAEPVAARVIAGLNPAVRTLDDLYEPGVARRTAYEAMVERILGPVRAGRSVCAAFYGHPGVFVTPGHEAVRQARAERFEARMLPGISAADCLFADLGIDPGATGCQLYEATDFLDRRPAVDPGAVLVLWQVTVLGRRDYVDDPDLSNLPLLVEHLRSVYADDHEVIAYEASPYPIGEAVVRRIALSELAGADLPRIGTLVFEPAQADGTSAPARSSVARTAAAATTLPLAE
ncbi:MAG TPA: SAM-dependent methyltransferase [Gaiellaceae bacterium]|nr:SAM-dependent methyltransferase [Gaiellaceae bacterium]